MNTDWIAYLITAAAAVALVIIAVRKQKKGGGCCKDSCSLSKPPDKDKRPS